MRHLLLRPTNPPPPIEGATWIPLTHDQWALVDDEDCEKVKKHNWFLVCNKQRRKQVKYAAHISPRNPNVKRRKVFLHRFVLDVDTTVDHINGNGLDNRKINLRVADNSQNHANIGKPRTNTSGFKGVTKHHHRWIARIKVAQKHFHIGSYKTKEEAARAYDKAAKERFGEFAYLNFPEEIS